MNKRQYNKQQNVFKKQHDKIVKQTKERERKVMPINVSTTLPVGMEVTPEQEKEHVLIRFQGSIKDVIINDRTKNGLFVKIGGDWFTSSSIDIVHKFDK